MNNTKLLVENKAYRMRLSCITMTTIAGSGHPTSCMSAADIVAALFFYAMRYDPSNPHNPFNDRFILSKGHASPLLYAAWKEAGVLTNDDLRNYRAIGSPLEGHPTLRFSHTEAATGSLGIGLSIGVGMALAAQLDNLDYQTYVLLGDGELAEGSVWEALELAHHYKLSNLIGIVDCNRLGQSDETLHGHHVQRYADKFAAFGWKPLIIDGHDVKHIMDALDKAREIDTCPVMIIAKTIKGYGAPLAENKLGFHGKPFSADDTNLIFDHLEKAAKESATFEPETPWKPTIAKASIDFDPGICDPGTMGDPAYELGQEIATRKAFGQTVAQLGKACSTAVVLDGDVKNSTFTELFEKKNPKRFIQCFIAEQNMISVAVGLHKRGKTPFVATFGAFMSRAHDQIRMAAIGQSALRLVGSHAGVSIGQDGPSQMALEDIALMCSLPDSIVLYPCDAVSTYRLVQNMSLYHKGISYLRTTRASTPVIYDTTEEFPVGGCKILRQSDNDAACIVAAGITVFEALKAYDQLQELGISIAIIDLYSIKPLDVDMLTKIGKASNNKIITVEDHYLQGGIGQTVSHALRNTGIHIDTLAVVLLLRLVSCFCLK